MTLPAPQPTPWQTGTGLDPARTALVVVDVLGGPNPVAEPLRDMAANAVRLARAARAAGVPVVFACDAHLPGTDLELALWGEHSMRGTPDSRPLDAFEAGEGDYIIPKRRYDAFFGTDLDITLRELGRDTLVVVGFDTNICVRHTVADAFFNNYATVVVSDATAAFLVGDQDEGLAYMERCYGSVIATTDDVIAALGR